ncbi:hypothetical protein TNCV_3522331 [Trichonephila clavipes]|uniref:Uncharacterized protein n=1 Tax=Trichonephila clavipes TaxID=2585209 RepID=A0A8X6W8X7_TRICX|nr:hypothetical protein TNCV_3522331 [Trichonephila clavipes]
MLVRPSRAPVLSGGLRHKTQLFSGTLYMAASTKTPPHQSKGPQKSKTPLQVPVFPGSSLLCHHTNSENPSNKISFHSVLVCHRTSWQKNKDNKLNTKKKSIIQHKRSNKIKILKEI